MLNLRNVGADEWRVWREVRLQALREAPYAFCTKFEDWQGEGDTEQRWRRRLADVPFNLVAELDGKPAGMVSATHLGEDGEVELISMWVAPFARGRRVGDALISAVIQWARERRASRVALSVMENNERAVSLYRRHQFVDDGKVAGSSETAPSQRGMTRRLNPATSSRRNISAPRAPL